MCHFQVHLPYNVPYTRQYKPRLVYFLSHFSLRLVLQTIYVLNKEIWAKNPRFIIESGFKSKAGYNGARTRTCRNNIIHSALFYAIVPTITCLVHIYFLYLWQCQNQIGGLFSLFWIAGWIVKPPTFYNYHENFICSISFRKSNSWVQSFCHIFLKPIAALL